jgi:curli biogenesis system outer membrane secretion channel CsgG
MRSSVISIGVVLLLIFAGCATVPQPNVVNVSTDTPAVSPVLADNQPRSLKRVVAIARFSNETNYGKGLYLGNAYDAGKQAMDIMNTKLTQSGKFILLERSDLEFLEREKVFDHSAMDQIPADYLIIGSITDFGRRATGKVGIFSRTQKQTAYAKVNVRLVDVRTGQIIYGETGEGEAFSEAGTVLGAGSQAGYDSTLNDKAIDAAISKLVVNISNNLLNNPWRSYILSQQDGIWMLAGGKTQGIKVGDVFTVKLRGDTVINPQTKLPIELPGTNVARLRVIQLTGEDLQSEISFCELLDGEIDSGQLTRYFVTEDEQ